MEILDALKHVTTSIKKWVDDNKVDKVSGKGLSTNDYTAADKKKVASIPNDLVVDGGKLFLAQDGVPITDSAVAFPTNNTSGSGSGLTEEQANNLTLNTAFRETLTNNVNALDKFTLDENGGLLFNNQPIKADGVDVNATTDPRVTTAQTIASLLENSFVRICFESPDVASVGGSIFDISMHELMQSADYSLLYVPSKDGTLTYTDVLSDDWHSVSMRVLTGQIYEFYSGTYVDESGLTKPTIQYNRYGGTSILEFFKSKILADCITEENINERVSERVQAIVQSNDFKKAITTQTAIGLFESGDCFTYADAPEDFDVGRIYNIKDGITVLYAPSKSGAIVYTDPISYEEITLKVEVGGVYEFYLDGETGTTVRNDYIGDEVFEFFKSKIIADCTTEEEVDDKIQKAIVDCSSADTGFVTPEMYGAVGDGITDDSVAFMEAIRTGKRVICNSEKTYYFTNDIDVRDLQRGHLDGNNAAFKNFHIFIGLTDDYQMPASGPSAERFVIENMYFTCGNNWQLGEGWERPCITTGSAMMIKNIVTRSYPYILATPNAYLDYMLCDSWTSAVGSGKVDPDTGEIPIFELDAISVVNGMDDKGKPIYCKTNVATTSAVAGDSWKLLSCNEFRTTTNPDYCLIRVYNRQPILMESCIQSRVEILKYGKVIANGCHWEKESDITSTALGDGENINALFINCFFYANHKLINGKNVTYLNCFFRNNGSKTQTTLSYTTNNKSWYDLKCRLINCSVSIGFFVDTDKLNMYKILPKKTYNTSVIPHRQSLSTNRLSVDTGAWLEGFFSSTGIYTYYVYLFATSQPDIAIDYAELTANITQTTSIWAMFEHYYLSGGYGFKIIRKDPSGNYAITEWYSSPSEIVDSSNFGSIEFRDWGSFASFRNFVRNKNSNAVVDTIDSVTTPWITIDSMPEISVNNVLYEANGSLITSDNSDLNVDNGQIQITPKSVIDQKVDKSDVYITVDSVVTDNFFDEIYENGTIFAYGTADAGENRDVDWALTELYRSANHIPVIGGKTIVITIGDMSENFTSEWIALGLTIFQYDENKVLLEQESILNAKYHNGAESTNLSAKRELTLNANTCYIRFTHYRGAMNIKGGDIQIALSYKEDNLTTYIPHFREVSAPYIDGSKMSLKSPNGTCYTFTVTDEGMLNVELLKYEE